MTKKQREEQLQFISSLVEDKKEYTKEQENLIIHFIFNILCSNLVLNRYELSTFTDINTKEGIRLYDCINWLGNKIKEV